MGTVAMLTLGTAKLIKVQNRPEFQKQMPQTEQSYARSIDTTINQKKEPTAYAETQKLENKETQLRPTAIASVQYGTMRIGPRRYELIRGPPDLLQIHLPQGIRQGNGGSMEPMLLSLPTYFSTHTNILAIASGTYYLRGNTPFGLVRINGTQYYSSQREAIEDSADSRHDVLAKERGTDWSTYFYINQDGRPGLVLARGMEDTAVSSWPTAIEVGRLLVQKGQLANDTGKSTQVPRMAICVTADHQVIFMATSVASESNKGLKTTRRQFSRDLLALIPNLESAALLDGSNAAQLAARNSAGKPAMNGLTHRGTPNVFTFEPVAQVASRQ